MPRWIWRPRPESNRGARICSPLRNHSATRPHPRKQRGFRRSPKAGQASFPLLEGRLARRLAERPRQITICRRMRRIAWISRDRTNAPSGIIQKPRTGRKPKTPPTTSAAPSPIRPRRVPGIGYRRPRMRMLSPTSSRSRVFMKLWRLPAVCADGCNSLVPDGQPSHEFCQTAFQACNRGLASRIRFC